MRGSSTGLTLNVKVFLFGAVIVLIVGAALVSIAERPIQRSGPERGQRPDKRRPRPHTLGTYNLIQTENKAV